MCLTACVQLLGASACHRCIHGRASDELTAIVQSVRGQAEEYLAKGCAGQDNHRLAGGSNCHFPVFMHPTCVV